MKAKRILIVCPAAVRLQWAREIKRWALGDTRCYVVTKAKDGVSPLARWTVISYDLARSTLLPTLRRGGWDYVIMDEAHYLKSPGASRTQALFGKTEIVERKQVHVPGIVEGAAMTLALTGTPLPNRPRECFGGSVKVLTDKGWKPIVSVETADKLWDGEEWVRHSGLIDQGERQTINLRGIAVTGEHLFRAKSTWVSAREAARNTAIWNRILERGSENLPLQAFCEALPARLSAFSSNVIAARPSSELRSSVSGLGGLLSAGVAALSEVLGRRTRDTSPCARMTTTGGGCSRVSGTPYSGATTRETDITSTTAAGGYRSTKVGGETAAASSRISCLCPAGTTRPYSSTASTMKETTRRGTCDGRPAERTCKTGGRREKCSCASQTCNESWTNFERVYDIANAGPRRRFTVLSADGPVIAHNCYTLARALDHGSIDYLSAEAFEARYNPSGTYFGGVREEIGRLPELRSRLRTHFMVRRMKRDVLTQLPQVRYEIDYVEETGAIKRALAAERMLDIDPSEFNSRIAIDGEVSTVRKEMGVAKAPHVAERVKTMLEGGLDKLVLFGWHREVLDMWEEKLREFSPERIDGSTSGAGKERAKNRFIKDPDCRLIFGNLMSMGVGVDGLQTVCDTVLFGENSWVPGDNQQGVDRLDRMGQTSRVTAIFLVAQGSIDEKIVSSAAKKTRTIHTALDAGL